MKTNKRIYIAVAAGIAVAGIVGLFLATGTGKKIISKVRSKGATLKKEFDETLSKTSERLMKIAEKMEAGCMAEEESAAEEKTYA